MKLLHFSTLAFSFIFITSTLLADTRPLSSTEKTYMLKTIKSIKNNVNNERYGIYNTTLSTLKSASSSTTSANELYLKCYRETNFTRKDRPESEYRDWKYENKEYLNSGGHSKARQLQLQFLTLTLKASRTITDNKKEELVPELITLIDNCLSAYPDLEKSKRILHSDVANSPFATFYNLQPTLEKLKNWPDAPMDISSVYEFTILPIYRSPDRAKELTAAWDKRISQEILLVLAADSIGAERSFNNITLPKLKWAKYLDLLRADRTRVALTSMLSLVSNNPNHQDIDQWINDLQGYLLGELTPSSFEVAAKEAEEIAARKKQDSNRESICNSEPWICSNPSREPRYWWIGSITRENIPDESTEQQAELCDCGRNVNVRNTPSQSRFRLGRENQVPGF